MALQAEHKLALYMQDNLDTVYAKMGLSILRYYQYDIACVIDDGPHVGKDMLEFYPAGRSCPIVRDLDAAKALGANVFVLGTAPSGGMVPDAWWDIMRQAVAMGFSLVNGMHKPLNGLFELNFPGQFIWDIRQEPPGLKPGVGAAAKLNNKRVLMVGTDMAVGKKTTGLELYYAARKAGRNAAFVATGQGGISIVGSGIPLDAIRVDFAGGAVEQEVMRNREAEIIFIEGQGSLAHPGSTATLPLMRGSQPTHLVMCIRLGQTHLATAPDFPVPQLKDFIPFCETVAAGGGNFARPITLGVSANTAALDPREADTMLTNLEQTLGLPCLDPVRHGPARLLERL